MSEVFTPRIQQPTDSYVRHYPGFVDFANKQLEDQFWTAGEMKVVLDKMQLLYELTPEQTHAVKFVLNLFVRYELMVGDMWQKVAKIFPRPEVQLVASVIEMIERAVHAEFYNEINIQLGLDTEDHYMAFLNDPVLRERVEWLGGLLNVEDDPILATIIFSMTETAILFSNFAILKSFQSNGHNMIPVTVRGTNQSAIDEDLHGQVSAAIINQYYSEMGTTLFEDKARYEKVRQAVFYARDHEFRIIDLAIPGESLNGVKKSDFKKYVCGRLNTYLERLGLPHEFEDTESPIDTWFELNTVAYKVVDFFTPGVGSEYEQGWSDDEFTKAFMAMAEPWEQNNWEVLYKTHDVFEKD